MEKWTLNFEQFPTSILWHSNDSYSDHVYDKMDSL